MARRVCPIWVGYLLLNPLRKLFENPDKILAPYVDEGMIVLEPGSGMGFFTLPLARMVGPTGKVVALDVQPKMLSVLRRRAEKVVLLNRIELRLVEADGLDVKDLAGAVDLVAALHMVHEVPDEAGFFAEVREALKPDGKLLIIEPRGHVSQTQFEQTVVTAEKMGFKVETSAVKMGGRGALLVRAYSNSHSLGLV
jgi:ubiquinone/menaquinone biosynthesis C-methylase UbiE